MLLLSAPWVLPIDRPPIRDGWITIEDGRVSGLGGSSDHPPRALEALRLEHAALMPGLVNAHTHLELTHLRGQVPAAARFTDWIRDLMQLRREREVTTEQIAASVDAAIAEARASGTAIVGDISNTLVSIGRLEQSPLSAHVFFELLRFRGTEVDEAWQQAMERLQVMGPAGHVRVSVTPHAPYSVSPRLFGRIREHRLRHPGLVSIHVCESLEECELVETGRGPWRQLLEQLNAWDPEWVPPGCTPLEYLDTLGLLGPDTIVVHGVHLRDGDFARLRASGAVLVTCPRSNRHVGVGDPPVARFYEAGLRVAVGTDSLTSAPDLSVFGELAAMRRLAPGVPARRLLESATRIGAEALGFGEYGTLVPGARADVIAINLPRGAEDVEEYLVSGVEPGQVWWPLTTPALEGQSHP